MYKIFDRILWTIQIIVLAILVTCTIWYFVHISSLPIWLLKAGIAYELLFAVYLIIKKKDKIKMKEQLGIRKNLEIMYNNIHQMNRLEKNDFAISEAAEAYFEKVELLKPKLTPEEFSKYKTVLFGTEDPYIVTEEGKITVKACPGDFKEK